MDCSMPGFPGYHSLPEWVCSNSCLLSQWYYSTILSSVAPFSSCPQSFPVSGSFPMSQLFASSCHLKDPSQFILKNKLKINKPQSTAKLPTWKQIRGIPPGWERASGRWRTHTGKQDSLGQPQVHASRKIFDYLLLTQNRFIKLKSAAKISLLYVNYTSVKLFFKKRKKSPWGAGGGMLLGMLIPLASRVIAV